MESDKINRILENFFYKDKGNGYKKLNFLVNSGRNKLHIVLDFDRTLTKSHNKRGENISTWEILRAHLPQKAQKEYQELYNKYRPQEIRNELKVSDAINWWESILTLFKENKLRWSDIAIDIEKMPIRPYTKELIDVCRRKNIPTIIISAGIKDIIELFCQKFEIVPTLILSTNLIFSPDGYIEGWERESLIHVLNKKEKGHKELNKIKRIRPNTILIGDSVDDAPMVETGENVLRILVDDPRGDEGNRNTEVYEEILQKFDLIIKNKSLYPILRIIDLL